VTGKLFAAKVPDIGRDVMEMVAGSYYDNRGAGFENAIDLPENGTVITYMFEGVGYEATIEGVVVEREGFNNGLMKGYAVSDIRRLYLQVFPCHLQRLVAKINRLYSHIRLCACKPYVDLSGPAADVKDVAADLTTFADSPCGKVIFPVIERERERIAYRSFPVHLPVCVGKVCILAGHGSSPGFISEETNANSMPRI